MEWTDDDPTENGIYVIWISADEGEYGHVAWSEADRWKDGQWERFSGFYLVERSVDRFNDMDAAEAVAKQVYLTR